MILTQSHLQKEKSGPDTLHDILHDQCIIMAALTVRNIRYMVVLLFYRLTNYDEGDGLVNNNNRREDESVSTEETEECVCVLVCVCDNIHKCVHLHSLVYLLQSYHYHL